MYTRKVFLFVGISFHSSSLLRKHWVLKSLFSVKKITNEDFFSSGYKPDIIYFVSRWVASTEDYRWNLRSSFVCSLCCSGLLCLQNCFKQNGQSKQTNMKFYTLLCFNICILKKNVFTFVFYFIDLCCICYQYLVYIYEKNRLYKWKTYYFVNSSISLMPSNVKSVVECKIKWNKIKYIIKTNKI